MIYQNILVSTESGICTITINRPKKLNALNQSVLQEIKSAVEVANADTSVKGIILTGSGEKAFAAGADIEEFSSFSMQEAMTLATNGYEVMNTLEQSAKVIIAAVNGFALGGGCELAMACHLIIASENAQFGQPEVKLGLIPGYGGTQRLVQRIGKSKALELLMTGDMLPAQQALELGLVNYLLPQAELLPKATELINKIGKRGPVAITKVIEAVNAFYQDGEDGLKREIQLFGECFDTADFKEGTTAFLEKRKANFKGA